MPTPPVAVALMFHLDSALHLIEVLSPSLSVDEIIAIRRGLAAACDTVGDILEQRNLEAEGITLVGEFCGRSLSPICAKPLSL